MLAMTATVISLMKHQGRAGLRPMEQTGDQALRTELRRARVRIAQLEASLAEALRDNLDHFERARAAERRLEELIAAAGRTEEPGTELT
jgi:hypothetical protein